MHTENANNQNAFDLVQSQDFIANVAAILMPAISEAVNDAVNKAVTLATSPTMSKQDFANTNRISLSVLEKWIANGIGCLPLLHLSSTHRTAPTVRPVKW